MQGHDRNKKELNTDLDVDLNCADIFQGRPGVRKVYYIYILYTVAAVYYWSINFTANGVANY